MQEEGMARKLGKLTVVQVRNAKTGLHSDGGGLYLQVTDGAKSWLFRYRVPNGRERFMGLGSLNTISLADVRAAAQKCRAMRLQGVDPIEARKAERATRALAQHSGTTFKQAAEQLMIDHAAGWKNTKHQAQWRTSLEQYAYPVLASLPVQSINTELVLKCIQPIWTQVPETAGRVRGRIEQVLDWAKAREMREGENPARWRGHLDHLLPPRKKVARVKHHAALPYTEVGKFMHKLRQLGGLQSDALEFVILTAARTGEAMGMRGREIDWSAKTWTVPGERMKAGRPHVVPLSDRALKILKARAPKDRDALIFASGTGRPIGDFALGRINRGLGYQITTHGFRSTFKDWAGDCTAFPNEVSEAALAHAVGDKVEAAYRRGTALEKRRELMAAWADYCNRITPPDAKVIPIGAHR
jgi:integrase